MLLTLTSTAPAATDLGFLLHKHPDRVQRFDLAMGTAHVFYPEAGADRCTVALLLEVDPVGLVRGRVGGPSTLPQYVDDRPYVASSMLAVALGRVFSTALAGRCEARPDLAGAVLPLEVHVPAVPSEGGAALVERMFAPLGWEVEARVEPLDPGIPRWGESRVVDVRLRGEHRLDAALSHLYVLLPVLSGAKHYWVGSDEVGKLVRRGGEWLQHHPEREMIMRRYLAHQRSYVEDATARLAALDDVPPDDGAGETTEDDAPAPSRPLARVRRDAVVAELRALGAHRVVDLGCGEGALVQQLLADPAITEVVGVDVAPRELERAARRLDLARMPERQRARVQLLQSSVTYRDARLAGYDAAALVEVVEHLDAERLPALVTAVFDAARPGAVVLTTPNVEHNPRFGLAPGERRHPDHRFEWTRAELRAWADGVAADHGYTVRYSPVGDDDPQVGPPTQMAVFVREVPA